MPTRVTDPELKARIREAVKQPETRREIPKAPPQQVIAPLPVYPGFLDPYGKGPQLTGELADVARGALQGPYTAFGMPEMVGQPQTQGGRIAEGATQFATDAAATAFTGVGAANIARRAPQFLKQIGETSKWHEMTPRARAFLEPYIANPRAVTIGETAAGLGSGALYETANENMPSMPLGPVINGRPLFDLRDPVILLSGALGGAPGATIEGALRGMEKAPLGRFVGGVVRRQAQNLSVGGQQMAAIRVLKAYIKAQGLKPEDLIDEVTKAPLNPKYPLDTALATRRAQLVGVLRGTFKEAPERQMRAAGARASAEAGAKRELSSIVGEGTQDSATALMQRMDDIQRGWRDEINIAMRKIHDKAQFLPRDTDLVKIQQEARAQLDQGKVLWEGIEKELWNAIDKKAIADDLAIESVVKAYRADQANPAFRNELPSELTRTISEWGNYLEQKKAFLAGVSETPPKPLTVADLLAFRSEAGYVRRAAPEGTVEAAAARQMQDSTINALNATLPEDQKSALQVANSYTRRFYDTFYRGPVGRLYRGSVSQQSPAVQFWKSYETLDGLWSDSNPGRTVANIQAARQATMKAINADAPLEPTELTAAFNDRLEGFVLDKIYKVSNLYQRGTLRREGEVDSQALRNWLVNHRDVVKEVPGLERDLLQLVHAQETGTIKKYQRDFLQKASVGKFIKDPHGQIDEFLNLTGMKTPGKQHIPPDEWVRSIRNQLGGENSEAWTGFRRMFLERLKTKLTSPKERELTGEPKFYGNLITQMLEDPEYSKAFRVLIGIPESGPPTRDQKIALDSFKELGEVVRRWGFDITQIPAVELKPPSQFLVTTARVIGARIAGLLGQQSAGGSLQNALIASQKTKEYVTKATGRYFGDVMFEIMQDPALFKEVLLMDESEMKRLAMHTTDIASQPGQQSGEIFKLLVSYPRTYNFLFSIFQREYERISEEQPVPLAPLPPGAANGR